MTFQHNTDFSGPNTQANKGPPPKAVEANSPCANPFASLSGPTQFETKLKPHAITSSKIRLFAPEGFNPEPTQASRLLRFAVITSLRDLAVNENIGRTLNIHGRSRYFQGSLHYLVESMHAGLKSKLELVAVFVDDVPEKDKIERHGYSILPDKCQRGADWIAPPALELPNGRALSEIVHNHPSCFRKIPLSNSAERIIGKSRFERSLINKCQDLGADFILSDHCLLQFEHLHTSEEYRGRVLNIHPGVTWRYDPNTMRGLTPIADSLNRARDSQYCRSGASLHFIADEIDAGEVLADCEKTKVFPKRDTEVSLRYRNYAHSKNPVLATGLEYYCDNFATFSGLARDF